MSPTEPALAAAAFAHVALSVGDLEEMLAFYRTMGFEEISRADFAPAPVSLVTVSNATGLTIELTCNRESEPRAGGRDPIAAAQWRGWFHLALSVTSLPQAVESAVEAGASLIVPLSRSATSGRWFAYVADPEGNLIELLQP